jgi:hypothetical protein
MRIHLQRAFLLVISLLLLMSSAYARLTPGQETTFLIPRMTTPPTIDGTLDPAEWREASAVSGIVDQATDVLLPRPTTFYYAWDPGHLYFGCRTYLRPNYKPGIRDGRSQGLAYCYDDGLELLYKPLGANVSAQNQQTAFRLFLNCLGNVGDTQRLALGQQMKNWAPQFKTAARITAPGTAPNGGAWWELEVSTVPADFELTGEHRVGDRWLLMNGFNHIPMWMQARTPCVGGYYTPEGKCAATLVENTPAVQFTMDSLANLASDGTAMLTVTATNPTKTLIAVTVDVNIAATITRHESLELPAGGQKTFTLNEKLPAEMKKGTASVRVTQGERTLMTYLAPFEVGAYNWILGPVTQPDPNKFAFETRFNPVRNLLLVKADSYYLPDPSAAKELRYRVLPAGGGAPIAAGTITSVAEWYFQDVLTLPTLAPGKYTVTAELTLTNGKVLGPMTGTIEKKDEAKAFAAWWGKKCGNVERVLPPFTAIARKGTMLTCWGREYGLSALGLPMTVVSQGSAVLAAPARVVAVVNGKEESIPLGLPKLTEVMNWRVRFTGTAVGAGLAFSATGWLEQDGLVYVELTYRPLGKARVRVEALRLEFPIAATNAESLVCVGPGMNFASKSTLVLPQDKHGPLWSTWVTGRTGCNMKVGSFYPTVWIGSDRRGFLWWGDSDRGWVPDDSVPAHEALRIGDAVVLRNNLIGKPYELTAARTVAFSYMASPFKPFPTGWRSFAATDNGTFFQPHRGVRINPKTGKKFHESTSSNINWIHPESDEPSEWAALWAEQKKGADVSVRGKLPYDPYDARTGITWQHMSFQLMGYGVKSMERMPYEYFGDEWFPGGDDTWNETYIDYGMYLLERAIKEGGVKSTYWDLSFPNQYSSLLSDLSYRLPDGRVQPGYNGWNVRRFFMRLWAIQEENGLNPGAVGCHSTNAYIFVSLPWIDAVLDGERDWHLDTSDLDWIDYYPIERMRSMSSPHNWGVGICWMSNYTSADPKKILAAKTRQAEYLWMHDSWRNPYLWPANHMLKLPPAILDWGMTAPGITYHPYWRNPHIVCADKDILVSLWQVPGVGTEGRSDRVMIGVFNYNRKQSKDVTVTLDLEALGLTQQRPWQEFIGVRDLYKPTPEMKDAQLDYPGKTLTIKGLPPHTGRFIGVRKY